MNASIFSGCKKTFRNALEKAFARKFIISYSFTFAFTTLMLFGLIALAHAGTSGGGVEFEDIYSTLTGWTQGALGKTIAVGAFLTGIAMGIVRQSVMAIVVGLSTALAVNYTPTIIDSIVTTLIH